MDGGAPGLETPVDPTGVLLVVAVLAAGTAFGLYRRRTDGRVVGSPSGPRLTAADLGADLGPRATLVQFSSAFCQPCRATRQVLDDVAGQVDGVSHVEIDAEAQPGARAPARHLADTDRARTRPGGARGAAG